MAGELLAFYVPLINSIFAVTLSFYSTKSPPRLNQIRASYKNAKASLRAQARVEEVSAITTPTN